MNKLEIVEQYSDIDKVVKNARKYLGKDAKLYLSTKKDKKFMDEGCLSVRPFYGKVRRATKATVEAYNEEGKKFTFGGSGLLANIFQHEIDHLDGILFIDKAKDINEVM